MYRVKYLFNLPVRFHSSVASKFNPWHDYRAYLDQVKTYITRLNPYIELELRSAALNWDSILNNENSQAIADNIKKRKENEFVDIEHIVCKFVLLSHKLKYVFVFYVEFIPKSHFVKNKCTN